MVAKMFIFIGVIKILNWTYLLFLFLSLIYCWKWGWSHL